MLVSASSSASGGNVAVKGADDVDRAGSGQDLVEGGALLAGRHFDARSFEDRPELLGLLDRRELGADKGSARTGEHCWLLGIWLLVGGLGGRRVGGGGGGFGRVVGVGSGVVSIVAATCGGDHGQGDEDGGKS